VVSGLIDRSGVDPGADIHAVSNKGGGKMQTLHLEARSALTCWPIPVEAIPAEVLDRDSVLRRSSSKAGYCFAQVIGQIDWNTYRVRIAVDTRNLHDEKRPYLVDVPAAELPPQARITHISALAIPEVLLSEDQKLRRVVCEPYEPFALFERQIDWDLYCVRVAPNAYSLFDRERSYLIHLSEAELREYMRFLPEQESSECSAVAPPAAPASQRAVDLAPLEPVVVSEEDMQAAIETVNFSENIPLAKVLRHGSKPWWRLQLLIELVLYRAILRAVACNKALQETVRRVLVLRKRFGRRLISIRGMYEEDRHTYWSLQVYVPISLI